MGASSQLKDLSDSAAGASGGAPSGIEGMDKL